MIRLDLACGKKKQAGFTGIDISKKTDADIIHDLTKKPWPFKTNSVDEAYCSHFFEHLDGQQRIAFMEELQRILKKGAEAKILSPYYTSIRASQDPTHQWPPVSENTFLYFNKAWRQQVGIDHYKIKVNFSYRFIYFLEEEWQDKPQTEVEKAIIHFNNVVRDIEAVLTKL